MSTIYIDKPDAFFLAIVKAAFPGYNGRKFRLSTSIPSRLDSYWDSGSRNYYCFVQLTSGKVLPVESNHPFFEAGRPRDLETLPPGLVVVEHSIFAGKDMGITVYANATDIVPLLPQHTEISEDERIVLKYTRGLKPSYAGIKDYRFHSAHRETGISRERWDAAKASCIERKLLNKAGAITPAGRNALGDR